MIAEADGADRRAWTGPAQLRKVKDAEHLGLSEGRHWTTRVIGHGPDKEMHAASPGCWRRRSSSGT